MSTKLAKCEHCGVEGDDVVPFGVKQHTWLHLKCWYDTWGKPKTEEREEEMADNYPPSGRLFSNNKKTSAKAPDVTGNLEISRDVLDHLKRCEAAGKPINMQLAGWRKQSRTTSGSWYSLSASVPFNERQGAPAAPPPRATTVDTFDDEIGF